jgi:hypothetical protein
MISAVLLEMLFEGVGVLKVLAVAGGAGLGGLVVGLLSQLLARALTAQKLPGKLLHGSRLGGAGLGGWLVALWVFGGGGPGLGGGGGLGVGPGTGTGPDDSPPAILKEPSTESREPPPPASAPGGSESLRVEVLGKNTLAKMARGRSPDRDRCYRVENGEGTRLLTLAEVKDLVRQRRKQTPPLRRLEIVLYNDSPARDVPYVAQLSQWAHEQAGADGEKIKVDFSAPDANAPTE